ncbi:glutamate--tRNA ligase [Candidatus Nomurabacteria bacterium]|nr:glutamate--tRNA ligase [Candidatus Nomurabacteria bacterium]
MSTVITRFPPSPTGHLHIGSVRTALFNYLYAAKNGGTMVLRFEDTDKERSKPEFEEDILAGLNWLSIPYTLADNPRQSERGALYQPHIARLIESGHAYEAEEGKDGSGKKVVRFKNPNTTLVFTDEIRGEVSFDTTDLGDFVIAKNVDEPLYHLAVVIDDHEMGVTHVIRGEDHISNTPRQILILEALGFTRPSYAHIPLILAPDRSKLSKRHGAVSVNEYQSQGIIAEALINYLALLGWNPGGEQEIYTLSELENLFTLERVHKGGAIFDMEKLVWFNHEHLKRLSDEEFAKRLKHFRHSDTDPRLIPLIKERAKTLTEAEALIEEYDFLNPVSHTVELLTQNGKIAAADASTHLHALQELLGGVADDDFTPERVKEALWPYAEAQGRGAVLWPLRTTLSGREKSPDPFTLAALLGKKTVLERIEAAQKVL